MLLGELLRQVWSGSCSWESWGGVFRGRGPLKQIQENFRNLVRGVATENQNRGKDKDESMSQNTCQAWDCPVSKGTTLAEWCDLKRSGQCEQGVGVAWRLGHACIHTCLHTHSCSFILQALSEALGGAEVAEGKSDTILALS